MMTENEILLTTMGISYSLILLTLISIYRPIRHIKKPKKRKMSEGRNVTGRTILILN